MICYRTTDGESIFECPNCHEDTRTDFGAHVVQEVRFSPEGKVIGCDICMPHMSENADDFAERMCTEYDEYAREARYCE